MTIFESRVKALCDEVYGKPFQQITIDLVQDTIEELLGKDNSRDDVGASAYDCDILLDAFNPKFEIDISLLTRLSKALDEWAKDIEGTNIILGIPKEK